MCSAKPWICVSDKLGACSGAELWSNKTSLLHAPISMLLPGQGSMPVHTPGSLQWHAPSSVLQECGSVPLGPSCHLPQTHTTTQTQTHRSGLGRAPAGLDPARDPGLTPMAYMDPSGFKLSAAFTWSKRATALVLRPQGETNVPVSFCLTTPIRPGNEGSASLPVSTCPVANQAPQRAASVS